MPDEVEERVVKALGEMVKGIEKEAAFMIRESHKWHV